MWACLCPALTSHSAPGCVAGEGRAAGWTLIFWWCPSAVWAASPASLGVLPALRVLPALPHMWGCYAAGKQLIPWAQPWLKPVPGWKPC